MLVPCFITNSSVQLSTYISPPQSNIQTFSIHNNRYLKVVVVLSINQPSWDSSTNSRAKRRPTAAKQVTPLSSSIPHNRLCLPPSHQKITERNRTGSPEQSQSTYRQPAQSTTNPTTGIASTGTSSASKVYFDLTVNDGNAASGSASSYPKSFPL